ncbi:TrbC/VirB2 family protein [Deinococcus planocerae]|uniref:TrbC/VirB2 family protein n=1 Tax=Deinococcus planocerae TaxID=1737569 RepID=UPI0015E110B6|nr:TrbC/VirB2 family protein [Deinococcus planocerae]
MFVDRAGQQVFTASLTLRHWTESQVRSHPTTPRQGFVWGMAAAVLALSQEALAQDGPDVGEGVAENTSPFTTVNTGICTMSGWLRGPVGIGLVLIAIVVAGISLAVGGKRSTSILIAALAGAAVILGARSIMSLATGSNTNICATGAGAPAP